MKCCRQRFLWAALVGLGCAAAPGPRPTLDLPLQSEASSVPDRVLVISIARLTSDRYAPTPGIPVAMPTLRAMAQQGVAADAVTSVSPAASYPAHATVVTGQLPATHHIPADLRLGKRGTRSARYWHASHLESTSLWEVAARSGLSVAALAWPTTVGAPIPWLVSDIVPTRSGETWMDVLFDAATPDLLAVLRSHGADRVGADVEGVARDAALVSTACALLASSAPPSLTLIRLSQTVSPVAFEGAESQPARAAFARADAEVGRLLACLGEAGRLAGTAVIALGDHGTLPVHTMVSPNVMLAAEGLLTVDDETGAIAEWAAIARSNGGSAFVYSEADRDAVHARKLLEEQARFTRAFRVVSAKEMLAHGADREAWFGLEAEPGFFFGDVATGPLLQPGALRAVGGYFSERPAMDAGFVAWGRGLRSGVRVPRMELADIGPTVAALLGVELTPELESSSDAANELRGRTLVGILSLPRSR